MIDSIVKTLIDYEHLGGGKNIEIAKGKNEFVSDYKGLKRKLKRLWQLKK